MNIQKISVLLITLCLIGNSLPAQTQELDQFISHFKESLEGKDFSKYIKTFSPELRDTERKFLNKMFDSNSMEEASVYRIYKKEKQGDEAKVYLNVVFQNPYSVAIENWHLILYRSEGEWMIKEKRTPGKRSHLYRLKIPSSKVERVEQVEIDHVDIQITFRDALVFYDNIPQHDTAFLVLGEGEVYFSPSSSREKHQLEMIYNKNFLKDKLEYAYLRFSDSFFNNHIQMTGVSQKNIQVDPAEKNRAYSLFSKHYSRSFTVRSSINNELLSFLPRGEEAVFEFEGKDIGNYTYVYSPFSQEEVNLYQWKKERIVNLYSPDADENKKKLFISFGQMFDVLDYQIDIDFDPDKSYLSGKAEISVASRVRSLDGVKFKINPKMQILRVLDEDRQELLYTKDELRKTLYVYFLQPPTKDQKTTLEIYYRGKIESKKPSAGLQYQQEGISLNIFDPKYESFLYSRSSHWYPAPFQDDYFTARLKVIVPPKYTILSNGALVEKEVLQGLDNVKDLEKEGNLSFLFDIEKPVKYLSFVVGKLRQIEEGTFPLPLRYFRSIEVPPLRLDTFKETQKIIQFYESRFGNFPFPKLDIVHRQWPSSGGHSSASLVVLNILPTMTTRRTLIKTSSPVDLSRWEEYYLAHEIAHQWWGQGVTWESYHDQWISEGLSQYSAALYLRDKYGERAFHRILKKFNKWTEKKFEWGPIILGSRISYFDFKAFQAIVYNKTSLVLNMLKDLIGEEMFFKGLEHFFQDHRYEKASTHDFFRTINTLTGEDMGEFFDRWYKTYHLPETQVSHHVQKVQNGYLLKLEVVQLKDRFVFPLWVEWKEQGNRVSRKFIVDKQNQEFLIQLDHKPKHITVNPNHKVPGKFH